MKRILYQGEIWARKNREVTPALLELMTSKDYLVVLCHGKPPYKVVLGVPHQAAIGESIICDAQMKRDSDENAASYALVTFGTLKEHDVSYKIVIAAHSTTTDPNKDMDSPYCREVFQEPTELLMECHGAGPGRKLDLELSAGQNRLADAKCFGEDLASALEKRYSLGVQREFGTDKALIFDKDGRKSDGRLENPGTRTASLIKAEEKKIPALHLEAKPQFRKPPDKANNVTEEGIILGRALAQAIIKGWISEELKRVEQGYCAKVLNMTGAHNREIGRTKEYHGRQLLELLQNADDEAEKAENPSMLIRLERDKLIVANNGMPFSKQGVLSLMYSDNSPKIKRRNKIGYKGLGFRAVLNWSHSIWIKSGGLSLEFSRDNAIAFLKKLLEKNPALEEEIKEVSTEKYPIATLAVPSWKDKDTLDTSEYDTYIVIRFASEEIKSDIQNQINELGMEVALFLNNLRRIKLESPGRNETIMRVLSRDKEHTHEEVQLIDSEGKVSKSKKWRIFSKSGELPESQRKEGVKQYEYDLRIAVSEKLDDSINRLFCYFKTKVKFPFPAIIHGTFDLDENRNHLTLAGPSNTVNKFLLENLADLMIETALEVAKVETQVSWDAISLLTKKGEFDEDVEKIGFYSKLLSSMKSHKLIPVLSNKYMSPQEGPFFYDVPFAQILKNYSNEFPDLALQTNDKDVASLVKELGVKEYKAEEFTRKIDKISSSLSPDDRAELILLTASNYELYFHPLPPQKMPSLFTDEEHKIISSKTQTLLPPERSKFQLPQNISIVFISTDLFNQLRNKANTKTSRALADKLACFDVQEYRFDTVIRRVVAITNNLIKDDESKTRNYIKDMVTSLFLIFSDESDPNKTFPDINVQLFNRKGELRSAREVYFGKEYSVGKIMDALYSGIDESVFLSRKEEIGLDGFDENKVIKFLKWGGVEEFPRIRQKTLEKENFDSEYENYVLRNLKYPYRTDMGEVYVSYEKLIEDKVYRSSIKIGDIAELDDILGRARFEDILAWLNLDPKMQIILREGHELPEVSFGIWLSKKQNPRNIETKDISSYILWKLKRAEWVRTRSGRKVRPEICCLSNTLSDMSPLIEVPAYNVKEEIFKGNNIREEDIEYILSKIGASREFSALPDDTIYAVLSALESADTEGKKARIIYRQIIDSKPREWARKVAESKVRGHFVAQGKILAKSGGELRYFPVKDAYYVDNITFCKEIMDKFPIVQIDRRSGKDQVREIFGVKPLEDIQFSLISAPEIHPMNASFSKAFENFKPYILVFRLQKPSLKTELNQLRRLKIVLCSKISASYKYDKTDLPLQINPYEHIIAGDDNTGYLLMDPQKQYTDLNVLKMDTRFCDSIAEIVTGILKVGENRKDYRELFSKDRAQRDMIIQSDLDDPYLEKLNQANQLFRNLSDLEVDFWQTVLEAKGRDTLLIEHAGNKNIMGFIAKELDLKEEFLLPIYQGIYYENYSSPSNMLCFKRLFEILHISVEEFNRHSADAIDFTDHLEAEVTKEKYRLLKKFNSYLFQLLKDKPLNVKETFVDLLRAYENSPAEEYYNINKELDWDAGKYFERLFLDEAFKNLALKYSELLQQEEADLEKEHRVNLGALERRIGETGSFYAEDLEGFLDISKNRSLVFFGEYDELVRRFNKRYTRPSPGSSGSDGQPVARKRKKIDLNGREEEYAENDYQSLISNIEEDLKSKEYTILPYDPSRPTEKPDQTPRKGGGGRGAAQKKHTKEIGFVGEYYVYKTLIKKYSEEKVFWVSEYAKIANINPNGNDGKGYDIRYLDENNQVHYAEVKASNDEDCSFSISAPEVKFGEENKSNYEIIMVLNVLTQERKSINLGRIFEYREEESFNNNSKFSVENDGFRIRFQISPLE